MSWKRKLFFLILLTLAAMLAVHYLDGKYATETRIFLRNVMNHLF